MLRAESWGRVWGQRIICLGLPGTSVINTASLAPRTLLSLRKTCLAKEQESVAKEGPKGQFLLYTFLRVDFPFVMQAPGFNLVFPFQEDCLPEWKCWSPVCLIELISFYRAPHMFLESLRNLDHWEIYLDSFFVLVWFGLEPYPAMHRDYSYGGMGRLYGCWDLNQVDCIQSKYLLYYFSCPSLLLLFLILASKFTHILIWFWVPALGYAQGSLQEQNQK